MDATYIDLTVRLSLALILGGAIGIEREYRAKEAGFRTHFLVALGSALFCVVSQYGFGFDLKDSSPLLPKWFRVSDSSVPVPSSSRRMWSGA